MKRLLIILTIIFGFGCKGKLDLKPNSSIILPKSAEELEALLEYKDFIYSTPDFPQTSADEYFIPKLSDWQANPTASERNAAIWAQDVYEGESKNTNWVNQYVAIFYANSVLDLLKEQDISKDVQKQRIKGRALFVRAYAFYSLLSVFSKAYDATTATTDLGIPLKLSGRIEQIVPRNSVQECYDQIIKDILEASETLNESINPNKRNQPSKVAAFGMLARVYLSMRNYELAEVYVDKSLKIFSTLTDFNNLVDNGNSAFSLNSEETIYYTFASATGGYFYIRSYGTYGVDPSLINTYEQNDIRLKVYYIKDNLGNYKIRPINTIDPFPFSGLATDEMYLIKSECLARRNDISNALIYLNALKIKRWNPNATIPSKPYENENASTTETALNKILLERRKALIFRGTRWTDLKRFNLEGRNVIISRKLDDKIFSLEPNSLRYVLPIPEDEILLSGIRQNPR
ncbi:hypothetical protein PBAL39_12950 [Pedobacter sp. BAL39]|uniref:RagB/SusD family nutrient uptake outer membrane protein n=1 Tax=Pedobacter sp. BAL39 TaxID=391596 RepID=UPI0001559346|nr:RagB/SusD family nutrient uptake outer membrane protein [Pedobacter sp. BAL39]EDM35378.1 hypothetical protein PBAL39_12950 [Pedobacter sp. BAL39]